MTRPTLPSPSIEAIRGHVIYRRPERCPTCGEPTDLFVTGNPSFNQEGIWSWVRPHPRCALREFAGPLPVTIARLGPLDDALLDLGPVRLSAEATRAAMSRSRELRDAIGRHARGDGGLLGHLDAAAPPSPLLRWCPGAFPGPERNRLAIEDGRGLVTSRFREPLDLAILTALDGPWVETAILAGPEAPPGWPGPELPEPIRWRKVPGVGRPKQARP